MNHVMCYMILVIAASGAMVGCAADTKSSPSLSITAQQVKTPPPEATVGGLSIQIDEITTYAISDLARLRDDRPVTRRELRLSGSVNAGDGVRLYRIHGMTLDKVIDDRGVDLLAVGEVTSARRVVTPRSTWARSPSAGTEFEKLNAKIENLPRLPSGLTVLAGHVDAEVVEELQHVDTPLVATENFVTVSREFAYRVTIADIQPSTVSLKVEYRINVGHANAEGLMPPALQGIAFLDGDVAIEMSQGYSWPKETRVGDVVMGEYSINRRGFSGKTPDKARLTLLLKIAPVRFDFEVRDIRLAGADR